MAYDYEYFKKEVFALTKIDLNAYKEKQMKQIGRASCRERVFERIQRKTDEAQNRYPDCKAQSDGI